MNSFRISIVYNNRAFRPGMGTGWGFAAVIQAAEKTVLFDTGGDSPTLLSNMEQLGIMPESIDRVVLSHAHGDHTGGLLGFLQRNSAVEVVMPAAFPQAFVREVEASGAEVRLVREAGQLFGPFYTTGELDHGIREQALVVDTPSGLVVITGCAHPGVADLTLAAGQLRQKPVHLLMGGFHLLGQGKGEIGQVISQLQSMGVERVAPSHCTGEPAIGMFRQAWGENFVEGGCGAVIEIP